MKTILPLSAALLAAVAGVCPAANIISTFDGEGATPFAWSLDTNWNHNPASPGNFPKNGMGGNNYSVIMNGGRADLSEDITITELTMTGAAQIVTGGRLLTVQQPSTITSGSFRGGGAVLFDTITSDNGLSVREANTLVSAGHTTLGSAGGGAGSLFLHDGASFNSGFTFTMPNAGSLGAGPGGGTFRNMGVFEKTGGAADSGVGVGVQFENTAGASVNVAVGNLVVSGASSWVNNAVQLGAAAGLRIYGNAAINGASGLTLTMGEGAEMSFEAGTHSLGGSLASAAGTHATAKVLFKGASKLDGGTLSITHGAGFEMEGGVLGELSRVTNAGLWLWKAGVITGFGFKNTSSLVEGARIDGSSGAQSRIVRAGTLANAGSITHRAAHQVKIGTGGVIHNELAGFYSIVGGAVFDKETANSNGQFLNSGTLTNVSGATTFFTAFNDDALSGSIIVNGGSLTLQGETTLKGNVRVDRQGDPAAFFQLNPVATFSTAVIEGTVFRLENGGEARLISGPVDFKGFIQLGGNGTLLVGAATCRVAAGAPASVIPFDFGSTAKLKFDNANAVLQADDVLTSTAPILWNAGTLTGAARLQNNATLRVTSGMTVSNAATGAQLRNGAGATVLVEPNATLTLGTNGLLVNESGGVVQLTGSADIRKATGVTGAELRNSGTVRKAVEAGVPSSGGSVITCNFSQLVSGGVLEALDAGVALQGVNTVLAGKVRSTNAGADVQFTGQTTFGGVAFEFENNGEVLLTTAAHALGGTLTLTGAGVARLSGGLLAPSVSGTGTISTALESLFEVTGGTFGGTGSMVIQQGPFRMAGGTTAGTVESAAQAIFTLAGGSIGGTFTNNGRFIWQSGTLGGAFTNFAAATPVSLRITGNAARSVAANATVSNRGLIEHEDNGTVTLGSAAVVTNETAGVYEFKGGGTVAGAANSSFINKGTTRMTATGQATIVAPLTNTAAGKLESTAGGTLRISGQATVSGGEFKATGATSVVKFEKGDFTGELKHTLSGGGTVRYELLGGAGTINLGGTMSSAQTLGAVQFASTVKAPGALALNFSQFARGSILGTLEMSGVTTSSGYLELFGGKLIAATAAARFEMGTAAKLFIDGASTSTLDGVGAGAEPQFIFKNVVTHSGAGSLAFDHTAKVRNLGTYTVSTAAGLSKTGASATDVAFLNPGMFVKQGAGTISNVATAFDNTGTVEVKSGTLTFITNTVPQLQGTHLTGGTWIVRNGATLTIGTASNKLERNSGIIIVEGTGFFSNLPITTTTTPFRNDGRLSLIGNATKSFGTGAFTNNGTLNVQAGSELTAGSFSNGGIFGLGGGTLEGSGKINGQVIQDGKLKPGNTPGTFTVEGSYTQDAIGSMQIEIDGLTPGTQHDVLSVIGPATLGGTLEVVVLSGGVGLPAGSTFTFLTATSVTGTFATLDLPKDSGGNPLFSVQYNPASVVLTALGPVQPAQIQSWRQQYFGTTANSGDAADTNDFDDDGLENLLEYALDDDPTVSSRDSLPDAGTSSGRLALTFTRFVEKTDITITVQASETLTGTWTDLARSTAGGATTALLGGVTVTETGSGETRSVTVEDAFTIDDPAHPKRFFRLQVTRP